MIFIGLGNAFKCIIFDFWFWTSSSSIYEFLRLDFIFADFDGLVSVDLRDGLRGRSEDIEMLERACSFLLKFTSR